MANVAVTLNDVDVTSSVLESEISFEQALGRRWTATILRKVSGATIGQRIGGYFGGVRIFGGVVAEREHQVEHLTATGTTVTAYRLTCVSWEKRLDTKFPDEAVYGQVCYADDATDVLTSQYHGLSDTQRIRFITSGTLPAGLSPGVTYFVRDKTTHDFKVAATSGGTAIDLTDAGTGTHRFVWLARDIVLDLIGRFASGEGIDLGSGDIDDGDFINQIVIAHNSGISVAAALDSLAETCGFIWYIDPEVALNFKAPSTTAAPWDIDDDRIQSIGFSFTETDLDYRNRQLIVGAWAGLVPTEETFTGDGTTAQWWLGSRAEIIESITADGLPVTLGVDGIETGLEAYWNPGERNLRLDTALATGVLLVVRYRALGANTYVVEDTGEQTARAAIEGGSGIRTAIVDDTANVDALGSVAKAQAILDENKVTGKEARYVVKVSSAADILQVGQLQSVIITSQGINSNFLLDQISIRPISLSELELSVRAIGGRKLADHIDYFKSLKGGISGSLGSVRSGGGSSSSGNATYRDALTLVANVVNYVGPVVSPADGSYFDLKIVQGSGPYTITFDAGTFSADVPTNISDVDGSITRIGFIAESDNLWHVRFWY